MWISSNVNVTVPVNSIYEFYTSMVSNAMGGTFSDDLTQMKIKTRLSNYLGENAFKIFDVNNTKYFGGIDINNREVWVGITPWLKYNDNEDRTYGSEDVVNFSSINCILIKRPEGDIRDIECLKRYCITFFEAIHALIYNTGRFADDDLISLYCLAFHLYNKYRISLIRDRDLLSYLVRYICSRGIYYARQEIADIITDFCIIDMAYCHVESTIEFPDVYYLLGIDTRKTFYLTEHAPKRTGDFDDNKIPLINSNTEGDSESQNDES